VAGIDNVRRGRYNARKIGRNATVEMREGGIPETPVYEDMHANNDIRGKKKN
jgi:hypothetical protein